MKKFCFVLLLVVLLSLWTGFALADGTAGLVYSFNNSTGEATVTGYNGTEQAVVIPAQVMNAGSYTMYSVTGIGNAAFLSSSIQYLIAPSTLKSIGMLAFYGSENLQSVDLSETQIAEIGDDMFSGCSALRSISFPTTLTKIGDRAFEGCTSLQRVTLPARVAQVGDSSFYGCTSLTECKVLNSEATIENDAFGNVAASFAIHIDAYGIDGIPSYSPFEPNDLSPVELYAAKNKIKIVYTRGVPGSIGDNIPLPEEIKIGETISLNDYIGQNVAISSIVSNNSSILSVNTNSRSITGVSRGTATLAVSYTGGTSSAQVTVYKPVTSFAIAPNPLILIQDTFVTLSVTDVLPADGYQKYSWAINNGGTGVVMITSADNTSCTITALSEGEATLTCTNVSGAQATCKIIVSPPVEISKLSASGISPVLAEGSANSLLEFSAGLKDESGKSYDANATRRITFVSADERIASISGNGDSSCDVLLKAVGATTITAQSPSGKYDDSAVATVIVHSDNALTLPAMLTEVEEEAFSGSAAVEIDLGDKVTAIGSKAFAACSQLKLVLIRNGNCSVANDAFSGSTGVTIVCLKNSKVASWAEKNHIAYVTVDAFN